ncbi:MAG TPA: TIM barrel protein [Longimicrobiales bacterium]|nr:TIM barrel protein [Longimicrobiales bacterium]
MDRRRFLERAAGGLLAAGGLGRPTGATEGPGNAPPVPPDRIGLQLYTVRDLMADSVEDTLALVAGVGYREVEFAGYFERDPAALRVTLDGLGLRAPSTHVGLADVTDPGPVLQTASTLGHRWIVVASLPRDRTASLDGWRRAADELNRAGEAVAAAGHGLAYHNHAAELEPLEGTVPYDLLLERCDPELVRMQADLYWMRAGGADPVAYFERWPGRWPSCHVKDMDADGGMVAVGDGVIDFPALFAHAARAGLEHWFVEHDEPGDAPAVIERSYRYLATLGG